MAAPNRELEPTNLRLRKSELAAAYVDVSHALRGFYELADILIVLDEVLLLEISNFARQLKFSPAIGDDHPIISHLTASLWFRSMDLTITSSTSKSRGPSNERKNLAATEVTIGGFWREHAKGELRTRNDHEILKFLSPCWEKEFMAGVFSAKETIFGAFVQEILSISISLLLALYLVYPRYLFNMGPAYMFRRIDGYLALVLLTHGELVPFHRLTKYGEPLVDGEDPLEHRHLLV